MKRNLTVKSIVLSATLSVLLTACGSTGSSTNENNSDVQNSISGKAIDGYLQNAVVCLDLNDDGYCQAKSEPMTTTLEDGSFKLDITDAHRKNEKFDEAMLLVFGGVDVDTGVDFKGKLLAPNDGTAVLNVSPITTLIAKKVQKSLKSEQKLSQEQIKEEIKKARKKVAEVLEIEESEVGLDPVALHKEKGDDKLIKKALKVQKSLEALLVAAKVSDAKHKDTLDEIYASLADTLDEMGDEKGLDKLFEKSANSTRFKAAFKDEDSAKMYAVMDKISSNLDSAFEKIEKDDDKLEKVAAMLNDDFEKIKKSRKSGSLDDALKKISYLEDDHRFQAEFDWQGMYIANDLLSLGIEPTEELVAQLKEVYKDDKRAGVLFRKSEKLKEYGEESLKKVYERIQTLKANEEKKDEAEKARYADVPTVDLKALLSNKTLYLVDADKEDGKTSVEIGTFVFNADASVVSVGEKEKVELIIDGNNIYSQDEGEEDVLTFKEKDDDYYVFYAEDGEEIKFFLNISKAEETAQKLRKKFAEKGDFFQKKF